MCGISLFESDRSKNDGVVDLAKSAPAFFSHLAAWSAPITVADASDPELPLIFVNDRFCDLSGYARNEIIGRNCRFLQGRDTDEIAVRRLSGALAMGRDVDACLLNYRKDGSRFYNFVTISFVEIGDGRNVAVGCQFEFSRRHVDIKDGTLSRRDRATLSDMGRHNADAAVQTVDAMLMRVRATSMMVRTYAQSSRTASTNPIAPRTGRLWP